MQKIEDITKRIIAFRDARDWKQFHNPKDCAISLTLEAAGDAGMQQQADIEQGK